MPKPDVPSAEIAEFFLNLDQLDLPPGSVYKLVHDYYGAGGAYEQDPEATHKIFLGSRVLHRNTRQGDNRTLHLLVRASESFMAEQPLYQTTRRADHSYTSRVKSFDKNHDQRISRYSSDGLMVVLSDGSRVLDVKVDSVLGVGERRSTRRGVGHEGVIASLAIDGKEWQRLELSKDLNSGIVNLPDGGLGWVLNGEESQIEIAIALPEADEPDLTYQQLGRLATHIVKNPQNLNS